MAFLKKLFGGDAGKATQIEPPPTQEEFDAAEQRLKEAVERSPNKASSDITTMSSGLYELFSKRGDYLKANGDNQAFMLNTAISLGMYEMAAQSNYHTGWTQRGIDALKTGLPYANEALRLAPTSIHGASINEKRQKLEALLIAYSTELRQAQQAVESICINLRDAGIRFTNNSDPIWKVRGLKAYILALSNTIASVVYAVVAPGVFGPYKHLWKQDEEVFSELASFLGYYFGERSLPDNSVVNSQGDTVLSVIATIWRPTDRVHAMIKRFCELMNDPQEMKERRILWWTHPGADDGNARNVVYEYIVNELIHGPDLRGNFDDLECLDPADGMFLKTYMQNIAIEQIKALRRVADGL
jgi:hypothetical protein